jgi:hypothetical protein
MAQVEVEDAGVALAQGGSRGPDQLVATAVLGGGGGVGARVGQAGHQRVPGPAGRRRAALAFEPVEGPVPRGPEQPAPERRRLAQVVDALPGDEEDVLRDLGCDFPVPHDMPRDVPHPIEPAVEENAEGGAVAGAGGQHETGVIPFLCHPASASSSAAIVKR